MRWLLLVFGLLLPAAGAAAQPAPVARKEACEGSICWEVANRFRLFQRRADFDKHVLAWRDGADPVLDSERMLNAAGAPGWAADMVDHLCFLEAQNVVPRRCRRDGFDEYYLVPRSVAVRIWGNPRDVAADSCEWRFPGLRPRTAPRRVGGACVIELRLAMGTPTALALTARARDGTPVVKTIDVAPKDILVAGVGDSFTSGEGNPDVPAQLAKGQCFNRVYSLGAPAGRPPGYRDHLAEVRAVNGRRERIVTPGRRGATERDCDTSTAHYDETTWTNARARWMFAPCHRSLYGHQLRAALALAVVDPHRSVTYIPLGCTGATIAEGLIAGQPPREGQLRRGRYAGSVTEGQLANLGNRLRDAGRPLDLLFLSIGGNDVGFAGLVANVIVAAPVERWLLSAAGQIITPEQAGLALPGFARAFADLRGRLSPLVAHEFDRVVFVPYGNPTRHGAGGTQLCGATQRGFDAHPAFAVDAGRLAAADRFVEGELTPRLERLAKCAIAPGEDGACAPGAAQTMRYAKAHLPAFREHGLCASGANEPAFDACLRDGDTFKLIGDDDDALDWPFRHCGPASGGFAPYASRARWSRTVNDSFLTAMTFADTVPGWLKARLRNDGLWGLTSMVYGGAVHPTAEGHAAMADAALREASAALTARGL